VPDRVQHDVGDVVVDEGVLDFAGVPPGGHDAGGAQHPQVLGDQRLAYPKRRDQFVDGATARRELPHDAEPDRGGKRPQQLAGGLKGRGRAALALSCAQVSMYADRARDYRAAGRRAG
jgi:hypothetical protein